MARFRTITIILVILLLLTACNLPSGEKEDPISNPEAVLTAAAQTVEAHLTQQPASSNPTTMTLNATFLTMGISPTVLLPSRFNAPNIPAPEIGSFLKAIDHGGNLCQ